MIMKELALKYGCNPNQKPSRIFMEGDRGASHHSTERQTGLYQFHGRVKRLAAGKRAEGSHRGFRPPHLSSMFHLPGRQWACLLTRH